VTDTSSAKAGVKLRKPLFEDRDIFRACRLKLPLIVFVNMCDFAGLDSLEELYQPVSLLVPIFRAHNSLRCFALSL
jgi:hypothetical protein